MGGTGTVRRTVLRTRQHGEPHQRAVQSVRRPGQRGDDSSQSDALVPVGNGVYPGQRSAPRGAEGDRTGAGAGLHDPNEAAQNRRTDPGFGSESLDFDGIQLSLARSLSTGLVEPALLTPPRRANIPRFQSAGKPRLRSARRHCLINAPQSPSTPSEVPAARAA